MRQCRNQYWCHNRAVAAAPGTVAAAAAAEAGNKPWAADTEIGAVAVVGPDIVGSGTAGPGIVGAARTPVPAAPRTEQRAVGNIVAEEQGPALRQQRGGCNARPSSTRWDPHGTGRRPLLRQPMDGWQSSSARRWLVVVR